MSQITNLPHHPRRPVKSILPSVHDDLNQPYDRLPGTLETDHVTWAKPLPDRKLKVLFIIPYMNSREVVELAQRLDLDYTVIMNSGVSLWSEGYFEGVNASPLHGTTAMEVLDRLSRERLAPDQKYDAIVIAKVSWEVIPQEIRELILAQVERETGLVYVTPNRLKRGHPPSEEEITANNQFDSLFRTNEYPEIARDLTAALPFDLIPLKVIERYEEFSQLPLMSRDKEQGFAFNYPPRLPLCIYATHHGKGRIITVNYFDSATGMLRSYCSLSPELAYDKVTYDFAFALLAKAVLWSAGRHVVVKATISFKASATALQVPVDESQKGWDWELKAPRSVVAGNDLPEARGIVIITPLDGAPRRINLNYAFRDMAGKVMAEDRLELVAAVGSIIRKEVPLPLLPRGNYMLDVRLLDDAGGVLEFASKSFRVEDSLQITSLRTDRDAYEKGEMIQGKVSFSAPLSGDQAALAWAVDTWDRIVFQTPVVLDAERSTGTFSIPVRLPLCRLWDISCAVSDQRRRIDVARIWVGLPDWTFDDYIWPLIFTTYPNCDWKGRLYAKAIRAYGVNASNAHLIDGLTHQYALNERLHLQSISYAQHLGQAHACEHWDKECDTSCMAELGRMARHLADQGKPLDPQEFPYPWRQYKGEFDRRGWWVYGAEWMNHRARDYTASAKFGSPYYWICGEEYLSGEFTNRENSCFCKLCTKNFQEWCKKQYQDDLGALNAEWGSGFASWNQVRGILMKDAARENQLPRWVAFRHFMRSRVWSQFFIDWTDMMRRVIGHDILTGTNGHDHYDFSRFRNHMTSGKIYVGQVINTEWREVAAEELRQSFSGDRSFLVASQSMMMFNYDFQTPLDNHRLPWKMLFAGYRGFDWEQGLAQPSLGGMSCLTPDYSEPMPFFKNISDQVLFLERGIGKLIINSKPERSPVAILWSPSNHYISRLLPFQEKGFTGTWLYNISVDGGAISDALTLMKTLRIRPTFIAPEDLVNGALRARGFKALILAYNKGMSEEEGKAIQAFVETGGLVIASNEPGSYSRLGKKLDKTRLHDLFPITDRDHVTKYGKGIAAYLPNAINGFQGRFEKGDYAGSDSIALLLEKYADITAPVELTDGKGKPRRDTLTAVFNQGSAKFFGLLRASTSEGKEMAETRIKLKGRHHVWNVREGRYLGRTASFTLKLDLYPQFYALLPSNPKSMRLEIMKPTVKPGETVKITGAITFKGGSPTEIDTMGQVVHIEVIDPNGRELEWYRSNLLFEGKDFAVLLPVSLSEKPGEYTVMAEYPITGMKAAAMFTIEGTTP